jgi:cystathionine beta-synthase
MAHYDETAEEILAATNQGKDLAMIVIGAGTGGTLTGISKKIKQVAPHIKMIAVDPVGSILAPSKNTVTYEKGMCMTYKVEGIGYDFIPDCLDQCAADEWVKVDDRESFLMARRLIREEGLLCGGSSGSAVAAAIKIASTQLTKGQTCLVVLPDSIRNYMSKFLSDDWMVANEFLEDPNIQRIHQLPYSLDSWRWIPISALSHTKPPVVVDLKVNISFLYKPDSLSIRFLSERHYCK